MLACYTLWDGLNVVAYLKDEDSIAVTALGLTSARDTTVERRHAPIEALASSDGLGGLENGSARGSRDATTGGSARREGGGTSGQGSAGASARAGAVAAGEATGAGGARVGVGGARVARVAGVTGVGVGVILVIAAGVLVVRALVLVVAVFVIAVAGGLLNLAPRSPRVAALAAVTSRDRVTLSPRVATGTAPLPALAASVGAEGESKKSDLSVLHLER